MKKKKFIVSTGVALSMLCSTSFAAVTIDSINVAEGIVTVKGTTDAEGAVTYEVYDADIEKPVLKDIVGFGEIYPEEPGKYTFDFGLKNGGNFKVRVSDGDEKDVEEFDYASETDRAKLLEAIADVLKDSETAATEIDKAFTNADNRGVLKTIGIDTDEYIGYSPAIQSDICKKMAEDGKGIEITEKTFLELYNNSKILALMNNDADSVSEEILAELNFTFEEKAYDKLSAEKQKWLAEAMAENITYDSIADMEEMYGKVSALYNINGAKISNIESMVNDYADLLEITGESEYKKYKSKANASVNRKLINLLDDEAADTVDRLLEALDDAADSASGTSSGGGSSSGGSSLRGGSSETKGGYVIDPEAVEDAVEVPTETVSSGIFNDMDSSHWAYDAVSALHSEGIINGYGDGTFLPDRTVTREEFVKMVVVAFDMENDEANSSFIDVFGSDWFYPYVSAAYEKGIVKGDHLGLFGIETEITRQDASVMAARAMRAAGVSIEEVREYVAFADEYMIADYAKEDVKALYSAGKINGVGNNLFEPQRTCTRAEAAMIIYGISR